MIINSFLYHIRSQQLAPTYVNFQGKHFLHLDLDINLLHILFSVHPAFQADNKHRDRDRDPASWGMYSVPTSWALVNPTRASPIVKRKLLLLLFIEMELFTNSRNPTRVQNSSLWKMSISLKDPLPLLLACWAYTRCSLLGLTIFWVACSSSPT